MLVPARRLCHSQHSLNSNNLTKTKSGLNRALGRIVPQKLMTHEVWCFREQDGRGQQEPSLMNPRALLSGTDWAGTPGSGVDSPTTAFLQKPKLRLPREGDRAGKQWDKLGGSTTWSRRLLPREGRVRAALPLYGAHLDISELLLFFTREIKVSMRIWSSFGVHSL